MIRPDDFESRAGIVVSYLSVGAMRTALASLGALNRRDANPFAHDLDLAAHFPDEMKARQLRLQTQLYAQAHQGADPAVDAYSGFLDSELEDRLRSAGVSRVFVGGLATDYCVLNTVLDACALGFETYLLIDAIGAVDMEPGDGERAIERMVAAGANRVELAAVVG